MRHLRSAAVPVLTASLLAIVPAVRYDSGRTMLSTSKNSGAADGGPRPQPVISPNGTRMDPYYWLP